MRREGKRGRYDEKKSRRKRSRGGDKREDGKEWRGVRKE